MPDARFWTRWVSFTREEAQDARRYAREVAKNYARRKTNNPLSKDYLFIGRIGEMAYGRITDLPVFTLSWEQLARGMTPDDGGEDFPGGVDIKARPFPYSTMMIGPKKNGRVVPGLFFVLVQVHDDYDFHGAVRARIIGWCPRDEIIERAELWRSDIQYPAWVKAARELRVWTPQLQRPDSFDTDAEFSPPHQANLFEM